jgi:drug/metabolite transporter (DMT)-like permease
MTHRRALTLLALGATLWSSGGVLIKFIDLNPLAIAGVRSLIAAAVFALAMRQWRWRWTGLQWLTAGFFAYLVISFVVSTKLTTAANAILLQYTAPIYVILLSGPLLNEKIQRRDIVTLLAVLGGMTIFFMEKITANHLWGDLIALSSGVSFAGLTLCLRRHREEAVIHTLFLGHLVTAAIGLPFLALGPPPTAQDVLLLTVLGVLQLGVPYILYGMAIPYVSALEGSLIPVIEPILNPIWVALFFGEQPSKFAMAGGLVVILSVACHSLPSLIPSPD